VVEDRSGGEVAGRSAGPDPGLRAVVVAAAGAGPGPLWFVRDDAGGAAFAWGTCTGLALLAFAFGTHGISTVDVVRQSAFPGVRAVDAGRLGVGGLAQGVYAPALMLATLVAWPGMQGGSPLASEPLRYGAPIHSSLPAVKLAYTVPERHVLVDPEVGSSRGFSSGRLVLVPRDQILGRAWARFYSVWERRLLP
jgi:hypothetical protein